MIPLVLIYCTFISLVIMDSYLFYDLILSNLIPLIDKENLLFIILIILLIKLHHNTFFFYLCDQLSIDKILPLILPILNFLLFQYFQ
jgi:hypothetical protein